jgi:hypothetical protein
MCVILSGSNRVNADCVDKLDDATKWLEKHFRLRYVFPMPTLQPPTEQDHADYRNKKGGVQEYRSKWQREGTNALKVLDSVFVAVTNHEFLSWRHVMANNS